LGNLPSAILWTWPYHVSWFCSISFTICSSNLIQFTFIKVTRPDHARCVVDPVALGEVSFRVLLLSTVTSVAFHQMPHTRPHLHVMTRRTKGRSLGTHAKLILSRK
jgi:hypothetical protein